MSENQYQQNRTRAEQVATGKWISPGQTVKIANFGIKGGYFYYGGEQLKARDNLWHRSITDDPERGIGYVEWLASSRDDPDCDIGYVFLYFYGIERRLLVDRKQLSPFDRQALIDEIWRLKRIYGGDSTFNRTATNLLAHVWVIIREKFRTIPAKPDESLLTGTREFTSAFKYLLGKAVAGGTPVSSELALAWVRSHPKIIDFLDPAMLYNKGFRSSFELRYQGKYGQGITIWPDSTKLQLVYHPASPTLGCHIIKLDILDPNPGRLTRPFIKLVQLAELCVGHRLNSVPKVTKKNIRKSAKWIYPGQIVKIGNIKIKGGYFYFGKSIDNTEASLIDTDLQVDESSSEYRLRLNKFWPRYRDMSPRNRGAYLRWLASNRDDPDCYMGYVFLYFYGIEYRLLVDGKHISSVERGVLIEEIWRLKRIYGDKSSFNNVTNFFDFLRIIEAQSDKSLLAGTRQFTKEFKYLLGKAVAEGAPVSSELALAWVRSHPDFSLRSPTRRYTKKFDLLFKLRYEEKYGPGIILQPNKTKLRLDYYPASTTLRRYRSITLDLPDPSRLKAPVKTLMHIVTLCTDELDAYYEQAKFRNLKSWLRSKTTNSFGIVQTEDLSSKVWGNSPIKINKKEAETLANLVEKAGFGLAPDIRFHHAKPEISGRVVIFENGHGPDFTPGDEFNHLRTILRLGAMIATADGRVDKTEISVVDRLISDNSDLSETEKKSLHAYLHWRLKTRPDMSGLKNQLQNLNYRQKSAIGHILVGVALADGKIEPMEIKQLRKLYTLLGLDDALVPSDIHNLKSRKIKSSPYGSQTQTKVNNLSSPATSLNPVLLDVCKEETEGVKAVLDSIFVEENIKDENENMRGDVVATPQITGLDDAHTRFYEKLICKDKWSSEEVEDICKELNLMVYGAIEVINEWAFNNVNAPLIEDEGVINIDLAVAQEIRAL